MRVVIAEDHALLREGLVALLNGAGIDVVATTDTGPGYWTSSPNKTPTSRSSTYGCHRTLPTKASAQRSPRAPRTLRWAR